MEKLTAFYNMIDFIFMAIIIIGGEYWGKKYFNPFKQARYNFLAFATTFAALWVIVLLAVEKFTISSLPNMLVTYLVATSFYELIASKIFEFINSKFGPKKQSNNQPPTAPL